MKNMRGVKEKRYIMKAKLTGSQPRQFYFLKLLFSYIKRKIFLGMIIQYTTITISVCICASMPITQDQ